MFSNTKRLIAGVFALSLLSFSVTSCAADSASDNAKTLTFYCYASSGALATVLNDVIIPGFKEEFNADIDWIQGNSLESMAKLEAQKDNPQADAVCLDNGPQSIAQDKGLLAPLNADIVTNLPEVKDFARQDGDVGVAYSSIAAGMVYDSEALAENGIPAPTSWADLMDPRYEGHVVLTDISNTQGVQMLVTLAELNGGGVDNIDPGFEAAAKVAKSSFAISKQDDVSKFFQDDDAWVALWHSTGTRTAAKMTGLPLTFVYPDPQAVAIAQVISVVKGAPNEELANELINFMLSEDVQLAFAAENYQVPRKNLDLPAELAKEIGYDQELATMDWETINESRADWTKRWNTEVVKYAG